MKVFPLRHESKWKAYAVRGCRVCGEPGIANREGMCRPCNEAVKAEHNGWNVRGAARRGFRRGVQQ